MKETVISTPKYFTLGEEWLLLGHSTRGRVVSLLRDVVRLFVPKFYKSYDQNRRALKHAKFGPITLEDHSTSYQW